MVHGRRERSGLACIVPGASGLPCGHQSVFVRSLQLSEPFADVGGPCLCPLSQPGDRLFVESLGGEFRVVDPVGSHPSGKEHEGNVPITQVGDVCRLQDLPHPRIALHAYPLSSSFLTP